jgi:hypothetical protein
MKQAIWAGLALAGLNGLAAEPSLCTRLADEARRAPAETWAAPDPLAAWMKPVGAAAASPTVEALSRDARWREALAASDTQPVGMQQLDGAPVYLLDSHAGTAHCQSVLLVEARPGQAARRLAPPVALDGRALCMTQSAGFARVLGQPAFVVGGAPSMTSPDLHYRIAAWTGQGWAPACSLQLRRGSALTAAQRFCAPGQPACAAGQSAAQRVAEAYEADRAGQGRLDARAVNGGRLPEADIAAALNPPLAAPGAIGDMNPPFPRFGADEARLDSMQSTFSNADPRRLPVWVDGRWWLAVVGRAGVGWREGDATLVALFAPPGRAADGVASYQFRVAPTGLRDVRAVDRAR